MIAVLSVVIRVASYAGTRPPWSGRSASSDRFTCTLSHRMGRPGRRGVQLSESSTVTIPRRTLRASAIGAALNLLVWIAFLIAPPPIAPTDFDRIAAARVERDADPGHIEFMTDQPMTVAGRWHEGFGDMSLADRALMLAADPAIALAHRLVVPP